MRGAWITAGLTAWLVALPAAAQRGEGTRRLGAATAPVTKSGGPALEAQVQSYSPWKSGDRVRSLSSADVRAARQQQAPDLEWAGAAPGAPQLQPQTPYGKKSQASGQAAGR